MTTMQEHHVGTFGRHEGVFADWTTGFGSEAAAGAAAAVLAILGLAHVGEQWMMPIAVLAVGAALLIEGSAAISRFAESTGEMSGSRRFMSGGFTAEFVGGAAGIVLGILALVGIAPEILCSVAVLVFGGSLLFGTGMTGMFRHDFAETATAQPHAFNQESMFFGSGAQALVALATMVLGILALTHVASAILTLVALLVVGASIGMNACAMTSCFWGTHHVR
jgi:hypothetical protein